MLSPRDILVQDHVIKWSLFWLLAILTSAWVTAWYEEFRRTHRCDKCESWRTKEVYNRTVVREGGFWRALFGGKKREIARRQCATESCKKILYEVEPVKDPKPKGLGMRFILN